MADRDANINWREGDAGLEEDDFVVVVAAARAMRSIHSS